VFPFTASNVVQFSFQTVYESAETLSSLSYTALQWCSDFTWNTNLLKDFC